MSDELLTIDDRTIRARKFASQIMAIVMPCVSDKDGAMSRLIDAAYQADIEIVRATGVAATPTPEPRGWERRAWKDGEPWTSWYRADEAPTPQNMKFDGVYSYEYRPLYPGPPHSRPMQRGEG